MREVEGVVIGKVTKMAKKTERARMSRWRMERGEERMRVTNERLPTMKVYTLEASEALWSQVGRSRNLTPGD